MDEIDLNLKLKKKKLNKAIKTKDSRTTRDLEKPSEKDTSI